MHPIGGGGGDEEEEEEEEDVASYSSSSNGDRSTDCNRDPAGDVHCRVLSQSDDNQMEIQIQVSHLSPISLSFDLGCIGLYIYLYCI